MRAVALDQDVSEVHLLHYMARHSPGHYTGGWLLEVLDGDVCAVCLLTPHWKCSKAALVESAVYALSEERRNKLTGELEKPRLLNESKCAILSNTKAWSKVRGIDVYLAYV